MQIEDNAGRALPKNLVEDVQTYIDRALAKRPDIVAALAKLRASEAEITSAESDYYPTLGLEGVLNQNIGSVSINGGPSYRINAPAAGILLRLHLPLYDGNTRENNVSIARSKSAAAKEELLKAQDGAIRQIARAYDTVKSSIAEYDAALALVKASQTSYAAALDSYRHGVGTFTDAVTAQTEKAQAESTRAHAYASALTAAAALAFSTGELTSEDALKQPL
jgi:outer membrane protein TolC